MRDALNRTARQILVSTEPFHLSPNPQAHISNLWRTTTDVADTTSKVRVNLDLNDKWAEFAGPGGFNDPDMLQVGKGKGTTVNQHRTNFIMWAIAKAPLLYVVAFVFCFFFLDFQQGKKTMLFQP